MRRYRKRNPAAPELLGSKGAGGAEHLDRQADDDPEDMSSARFLQSFPARRIARHFGLSPHRATGPTGGAE